MKNEDQFIDALDAAMLNAARCVKPGMTADEALKYSQAVLNLAHAQETFYATGTVRQALIKQNLAAMQG